MTPSPETPVARSRYSSKLRAYMRSYDVLCHVAVPQSQELEGSYHAASTVTEEEDFVVSATVRENPTLHICGRPGLILGVHFCIKICVATSLQCKEPLQ
jgi:hypothetical protein